MSKPPPQFQFKSLLKQMGRLFSLPMLSALGGQLRDPLSCKTAEEMQRAVAHNLEWIGQKKRALLRLSGRTEREWRQFMQNAENFTEEQWEKMGRMRELFSHYSTSSEEEKERERLSTTKRKRRNHWISER